MTHYVQVTIQNKDSSQSTSQQVTPRDGSGRDDSEGMKWCNDKRGGGEEVAGEQWQYGARDQMVAEITGRGSEQRAHRISQLQNDVQVANQEAATEVEQGAGDHYSSVQLSFKKVSSTVRMHVHSAGFAAPSMASFKVVGSFLISLLDTPLTCADCYTPFTCVEFHETADGVPSSVLSRLLQYLDRKTEAKAVPLAMECSIQLAIDNVGGLPGSPAAVSPAIERACYFVMDPPANHANRADPQCAVMTGYIRNEFLQPVVLLLDAARALKATAEAKKEAKKEAKEASKKRRKLVEWNADHYGGTVASWEFALAQQVVRV
jgi:hypothetical protein